MFKNGMRPVHPGEVLREDYLVPLEMSANALAKALNVPAPRRPPPATGSRRRRAGVIVAAATGAIIAA